MDSRTEKRQTVVPDLARRRTQVVEQAKLPYLFALEQGCTFFILVWYFADQTLFDRIHLGISFELAQLIVWSSNEEGRVGPGSDARSRERMAGKYATSTAVKDCDMLIATDSKMLMPVKGCTSTGLVALLGWPSPSPSS